VFEAKILKDSICNGQRLTTVQVTFPRIILAEWNTHAMFARNTSSSRAIPFAKMVKNIIDAPFVPIYWGKNQAGMVASVELEGSHREQAVVLWLEARDEAVRIASQMADAGGLNLHKQIPNRLLEPWMWTTNCTTGDAGAWSNFFALRCHPDAEPHMQKIAYMAQKAYYESTPTVLKPGEWHTPYIKPEEKDELVKWALSLHPEMTRNFFNPEKTPYVAEKMVEISTGRCARTSYLTQEGTRDFGEDVKLHDRLRFHTPLHASPFEHVCQAMGDGQRYAKYIGWKSYRHFLPKEYVTDFQPNHPDFTVAV
jgi:thymidylate synthase ThyX